MDFSSLSSNDIETYNNKPHRISKSNINNKAFALNSIILVSILCLGSILLITMVIIQCSKYKSIYIDNMKQSNLNDHQRAINDQIEYHISEIDQMKIVIKQSIEEQQKQLNKDTTIYKQSIAEKRDNDNDILMIFTYLTSTINQSKKRIESLKIDNEKQNQERDMIIAKINASIREKHILSEKYSILSNLNQRENKYNPLPIESILLTNQRERDFILSFILSEKALKMKLLYQGTAQHNSLSEFKKICNESNLSNTLVIMQIKNGPIIGGFTYNNWIEQGMKSDEFAFLFNLNKKKVYWIHDKLNAIYSTMHIWSSFGCGDIVIASFDMCTSNFPQTYGINEAQNELTDGLSRFTIETLELFTLIPK